jgi:hypothetical protein
MEILLGLPGDGPISATDYNSEVIRTSMMATPAVAMATDKRGSTQRTALAYA